MWIEPTIPDFRFRVWGYVVTIMTIHASSSASDEYISLKRQLTQLGQCSHAADQRGVLWFVGLSQHFSAPNRREEQFLLIVDLSV